MIENDEVLIKILLIMQTFIDSIDISQVDWETVLSLGYFQRMFLSSYEQVLNLANAESKRSKINHSKINYSLEKWKDIYGKQIERSNSGLRMTQNIAKIFDSHKIKYVFFKTLEYYPDFGSDIDILVAKEDMKIAVSSFLEHGFIKCGMSLADKMLRKFVCYNLEDTSFKIELYPGMSRIGEKWLDDEAIIRNREIWKNNNFGTYVPNDCDNILLTCIHAVFRHGELRFKEIINLLRISQKNSSSWNKLGYPECRTGLKMGIEFVEYTVNSVYPKFLIHNIRNGSHEVDPESKISCQDREFSHCVPLKSLFKVFGLEFAGTSPKGFKGRILIPAPLILIIATRVLHRK